MSNTTIQLKFSNVTGNTPVSLANGEIAINQFDGKIFYTDQTGTIKSIQNFSGPSGLNGEIQFNDSGDLGASANLTFNTSTNQLAAGSVKTNSFIEFADGSKQYTANSDATLAFSTIAANGTNLVADANNDTLTITANVANGIFINADAGADSFDLGLQKTAVTPGTYGNNSTAITITVDQFGRITSVSQTAIVYTETDPLALAYAIALG